MSDQGPDTVYIESVLLLFHFKTSVKKSLHNALGGKALFRTIFQKKILYNTKLISKHKEPIEDILKS